MSVDPLTDFARALHQSLRDPRCVWLDYHIRIHFNDHTAYTFCSRYVGSFALAIAPEVVACAMLSIPDEGVCEDCMGILNIHNINLQRHHLKTAWRNVVTGELTP
jgi:hypothetical protein